MAQGLAGGQGLLVNAGSSPLLTPSLKQSCRSHRLGGVAATSEGHDATQRDLGRLGRVWQEHQGAQGEVPSAVAKEEQS